MAQKEFFVEFLFLALVGRLVAQKEFFVEFLLLVLLSRHLGKVCFVYYLSHHQLHEMLAFTGED